MLNIFFGTFIIFATSTQERTKGRSWTLVISLNKLICFNFGVKNKTRKKRERERKREIGLIF
jgi:hypothetical protein